MLKKVFKYEMRALKRYILPLFACILGIGVFAAVLGVIASLLPESDNGIILKVLSIMPYSVLILGIIILSFVAIIMILQRYYKSCFSDEGYLTFILPVDTDTLVVGKLLSGVLVSFISTLVMICSLMIAIIPPALILNEIDIGTLLSTVVYALKLVLSIGEMPAWQVAIVIVENVIALVLGVFAQIILFYTAITLGSIIMRKHKILGSVLFYFLINFVTQIISNIYSLLILAMLESGDTFIIYESSMLFTIAMNAGLFVLGYITVRFMLKDKLNLE